MNQRVAYASLGVLGLCVVAAVFLMFNPSASHDSAEIIKLIAAGVTGALAGGGATELAHRSASAPVPDDCTCGERPIPHPEFGQTEDRDQ